MIAVVKNSKEDKYLENLQRINRETQCLPDEVRAKIYMYGKNGYMLTRLKLQPSIGWITAFFNDSKGKPMVLLAEATLSNFQVEWKFSEMYKTNGPVLHYSDENYGSTGYSENGIPQ